MLSLISSSDKDPNHKSKKINNGVCLLSCSRKEYCIFVSLTTARTQPPFLLEINKAAFHIHPGQLLRWHPLVNWQNSHLSPDHLFRNDRLLFFHMVIAAFEN